MDLKQNNWARFRCTLLLLAFIIVGNESGTQRSLGLVHLPLKSYSIDLTSWKDDKMQYTLDLLYCIFIIGKLGYVSSVILNQKIIFKFKYKFQVRENIDKIT